MLTVNTISIHRRSTNTFLVVVHWKKNYKLGHLKLLKVLKVLKLSKKNNSLDFQCSVQMERQTVKTLSQKEQSNQCLHSFVGSIFPNT